MKCLVKKFVLLVAGMMLVLLTACSDDNDILIYTSAEDYRVEYMTQRLEEEFPEYDITIEYMSTGNHAAKLLTEGLETKCDISYDLEYDYMDQLAEMGILANISEYDRSVYLEDVNQSDYYTIVYRNGGGIIVNTQILEERGLEEPSSYEDLLKAEYSGLISMPNPKSSGTGYMFLKSLVNAWGEESAFLYFDELTPNILQYTSSGSGPVNALLQGEAAIGFGMTCQAVMQINEGAPLKVIFFEEGSPYSLYGQGIISGKENRECVKEVFDFLVNTYSYENNERFCPEAIFRDVSYTKENYPEQIVYSDMSGDTYEEKTRILEMWKY